MAREHNSVHQWLRGGIDAPDRLARQEINVWELPALPTVVDLRMAAKAMHVGRSRMDEPTGRGGFPCRLLIGEVRR
ncbi:hypothetical protein ACFYXF_21005 [Streptomyces sp. NPDC002680]|uniref:hypothetical protein n=1 Tax=Streptomyces sp. NPDC002680 TaxID=3364659 RepID=UPI00367E7967